MKKTLFFQAGGGYFSRALSDGVVSLVEVARVVGAHLKNEHATAAAAAAAAAAACADPEGSVATTEEADSRQSSPAPSCNGDAHPQHPPHHPHRERTDSVETYDTGETGGGSGGPGGGPGGGAGGPGGGAVRPPDYANLPLTTACQALLGRPLLKVRSPLYNPCI